jgi:hypothetical protein
VSEEPVVNLGNWLSPETLLRQRRQETIIANHREGIGMKFESRSKDGGGRRERDRMIPEFSWRESLRQHIEMCEPQWLKRQASQGTTSSLFEVIQVERLKKEKAQSA